jgi:hypothetical protein
MLFHCGQIRSLKKISGLSKLPLENTQENKITVKNPKITLIKQTTYMASKGSMELYSSLKERKQKEKRKEKKNLQLG